MLWSKFAAVTAIEIALGFALGRVSIPLFRKLKTGKYDPYIGDRFSADGSEPAFGGAVMLTSFVISAALFGAICGQALKFTLAAAYVTAVTAAGITDDVMTDVFKLSYTQKSGVKLAWSYLAALLFLAEFKRRGFVPTQILLPFRLGYADLGAAFVPVGAAVMTAAVYAYRLLNRFGTDEKTCVGGLCEVTALLQLLSFAAVGTVLQDDSAVGFGYMSAAAIMGALAWSLSPSKLRSGASGGFFCGAACAAAVFFSPYAAIAAIIPALTAAADAASSAVQYGRYRLTKKLTLKGSSLHNHMTAKGFTDYKIILIYAAVTAALGALAAAYANYAAKIII